MGTSKTHIQYPAFHPNSLKSLLTISLVRHLIFIHTLTDIRYIFCGLAIGANLCQVSGWCGHCRSWAIKVSYSHKSLRFYWGVASFLYIHLTNDSILYISCGCSHMHQSLLCFRFMYIAFFCQHITKSSQSFRLVRWLGKSWGIKVSYSDELLGSTILNGFSHSYCLRGMPIYLSFFLKHY